MFRLIVVIAFLAWMFRKKGIFLPPLFFFLFVFLTLLTTRPVLSPVVRVSRFFLWLSSYTIDDLCFF